MGALCTHNNVARECRECARDLLAEGRELRRELDSRIAKMREMPEPPEIATLRADNDRLRAQADANAEAAGGALDRLAAERQRAEWAERVAGEAMREGLEAAQHWYNAWTLDNDEWAHECSGLLEELAAAERRLWAAAVVTRALDCDLSWWHHAEHCNRHGVDDGDHHEDCDREDCDAKACWQDIECECGLDGARATVERIQKALTGETP